MTTIDLQEQATLLLDVSPEFVAIHVRNIPITRVPIEHILRLHHLFGIRRGLRGKDPIIPRLQNGNVRGVSVSDLKNIFGHKWLYVLAPTEKIDRAEEYKMQNTRYYGHARGVGGGAEQYALYWITQYISNNISDSTVNNSFAGSLRGTSPLEAAEKMRSELCLDLLKFRSIGQVVENDSGRFNFMKDLLNDFGIFVFSTHNRDGVMPQRIPDDASFDGVSIIAEQNNACALCLNSKIVSFNRRLVTALALVYSIGNGKRAVFYHDDDYCEVDRDSFYFAGLLLLNEVDIDMLRNEIASWEDAKKCAKIYGVSPSFLNWFLFYDQYRNRYEVICSERPEITLGRTVTKGKGGQSPAKAFTLFYPKSLLLNNLAVLGNTMTARRIYCGIDKKDAKKFLNSVRREYSI